MLQASTRPASDRLVARAAKRRRQSTITVEEVEVSDDDSSVVSSHPNGGACETGAGLNQPCFLETDWQIGAALLLPLSEQQNEAVKTRIEPGRI